MKVGLLGPSYQERSLPFDAQRTVNLYPVLDEIKDGKEVGALYGTPGLTLLGTAGIGPIRAEFSSANGRAFVVSYNEFYEVFSDGSSTLYGTVGATNPIITMDENVTQLAICDGQNLYIFTYATNTYAQVTDPDFPGAGSVTFQNEYFIVNKPTTGQFYISGLANGTSWAALDFATAEDSPDNLVRVFGSLGQLWLFGDRTTEIDYDSGNVDFPFAKLQGAKMEIGCAAPLSVLSMDNTVFWIGKSKNGQGVVYRANGYTPQRISTHAIEYKINQTADLSTITAYSYQQDGHVFYCLNLADTTFCYDASTKLWHERCFLEADGTYSPHKALSCMFAFNKHLVGDKTNGNIYELSQEVFADNSSAIKRQRTFSHLFNEAKPFRIDSLQVDFEYGVGLTTGQGSVPVAWLEISEDGGRTWSPELQASIGVIGSRKIRAKWRRLGMAAVTGLVTFRVSISDPVKVAICGAYFNV